jgi:hypothetical protein
MLQSAKHKFLSGTFRLRSERIDKAGRTSLRSHQMLRGLLRNVPEGLYDRSPIPQSDSTELAEVLRRDHRRWLRKPLAVGRAVVCEGGLARSAWGSATPKEPSRRVRRPWRFPFPSAVLSRTDMQALSDFEHEQEREHEDERQPISQRALGYQVATCKRDVKLVLV